MIEERLRRMEELRIGIENAFITTNPKIEQIKRKELESINEHIARLQREFFLGEETTKAYCPVFQDTRDKEKYCEKANAGNRCARFDRCYC